MSARGREFRTRASSPHILITGRHVFWGAEIAADPPSVHYDEIMADDKGVGKWTETIVSPVSLEKATTNVGERKFGFSYVDGSPVSPEKTQELLERIAFIRVTHYGMQALEALFVNCSQYRWLLRFYIGPHNERHCVHITRSPGPHGYSLLHRPCRPPDVPPTLTRRGRRGRLASCRRLPSVKHSPPRESSSLECFGQNPDNMACKRKRWNNYYSREKVSRSQSSASLRSGCVVGFVSNQVEQ